MSVLHETPPPKRQPPAQDAGSGIEVEPRDGRVSGPYTHETATGDDDTIATQASKPGGNERQSSDADPVPISHEALMTLARLLGRQAAIETTRSNPATT